MILDDYSVTCKTEKIDCNIIIDDDMAGAYTRVRPDLVEKNKISLLDINQYHGLTIAPYEINDKFTILINLNYINDSLAKNNVDYVGTVVHEAVHVNDFKNYFKIVQAKSYDELFDYHQHRLFQYWTEFHARAIGHYFLRKYTLDNFKDEIHLNILVNYELPYQLNYMVSEVANTDNNDQKMYVIVHFLGRLAVWRFLYPNFFNDEFINNLTCQNVWIKNLFYFFIENDSLEKVYANFYKMHEIIGLD